MDQEHNSNFATGFLIGLLLCVILWYWQKSTEAEDGALALLERYAAKERLWQVKEQPAATAVAASSPLPSPTTAEPVFDFLPIKGIGPVFNQRLHEANVTALAHLLAMSANALAELLDVGSKRAEAILADAQTHQPTSI